MKNITILDVAKVSGVSKSTISRYLRGESVSIEKSEQIEKAIIETGYIRNNYAQLLRTNKSGFIGVLVPDIDNQFFTNIIKRLDYLAYKDNKSLIIKTTMSDLERELKAIDFIRGFRVEGIFLCRSELDDGIVDKINFDIPVISIDKEFKNLMSVTSKNFENGYLLTQHVAEQVSGPIMFFSRKQESNSVHQRMNGYLKYLKDNNRQPYQYTYDRLKGLDYDDLKKYVIDNNIEAIIARNDNEAIKVQSYFHELTYKGDMKRIRVAGFDNIRLSKSILPRLTTISQNIDKMCDKAYEIYTNYNPKNIKTYVQDSELIVRESTT
jgi:DNA-binding LacI/PurR family transcriptional regulator